MKQLQKMYRSNRSSSLFLIVNYTVLDILIPVAKIKCY